MDIHDVGSWVSVASGVRAHLGSPRGVGSPAGNRVLYEWKLGTDLCDLTWTDRVRDEATGDLYEVRTVATRKGLGLDHLECTLGRVEQ